MEFAVSAAQYLLVYVSDYLLPVNKRCNYNFLETHKTKGKNKVSFKMCIILAGLQETVLEEISGQIQ